MELLSKRYGWTPDQIRDMDEGDINAYLDIISIQNKHEANEIKKLKR
jgi:hypothetical protein